MAVPVIVVGGGLAGLAAAVAAAERGTEVALWSKTHPLASPSVAATGGINAALGDDDSWETHAADTLAAACGVADADAVALVCSEAGDEVRRLESFGVPFNRDVEGWLGTKPLAGGSTARTLFAGDHTGRAMVQALWQRAERLGVALREPVVLLRVVVSDGRCHGALGFDVRTGEVVRAHGAVLLATGGLGQVYGTTTNATVSTGDGAAAALAAGAVLRDMEMTQFYPTAYLPSGMCVTEEARSLGATLVNDRGERFLAEHDPERMELAGRDVIARAIFAERAAGRETFLDCRSMPPEDLAGPLRAFVDLTIRLIGASPADALVPVAPALHYSMGGVVTDLHGETTVPGLFCAGEVACLSVHGANRIGANSLLETVVMGRRAGAAATVADASPALVARDAAGAAAELAALLARRGAPAPGARRHLGAVMDAHAGIVRDEASLRAAVAALEEAQHDVDTRPLGDASSSWNGAVGRHLELCNMVWVAQAIVQGALARTESRGAHHRADAPTGAVVEARHVDLVRVAGGIAVTTSPVRAAA